MRMESIKNHKLHKPYKPYKPCKPCKPCCYGLRRFTLGFMTVNHQNCLQEYIRGLRFTEFTEFMQFLYKSK